jgi:hypothetical protein
VRTATLEFLHETCGTRTWVSEKRDFWRLRDHDIPALPGVYVLFGSHSFDYPVGRSPVFYVGQSDDLRERLTTHLTFAAEAKNGRKLALYYPRYEYAARFGRWYAFARTWQRLKPRAMEEMAMACFSNRYRAFPIANSAGSWNRVGTFNGYALD